MSRKYKFHNKEGIYFVSFATVYWIDVFVREQYFQIIIDSLKYSIEHFGMELYCWCIMPSHVHLIFSAKDNNPAIILGKLKEFTSKQLSKDILENPQESRKEWMLWMMERAAKKSSNVKNKQFWQHNNKPIELWSNEVIEQKVNYIHNNPVVSGFVEEQHHWRYSSAKNYFSEKGLLPISLLW